FVRVGWRLPLRLSRGTATAVYYSDHIYDNVHQHTPSYPECRSPFSPYSCPCCGTAHASLHRLGRCTQHTDDRMSRPDWDQKTIDARQCRWPLSENRSSASS